MDPRAWRRFKKNKGAVIGLVLVIVVTFVGFLGQFLAPHDPSEQFTEVLLNDDSTPKGPNEVDGFYLGADYLGRDELSRLLHGGLVSMQVAFIATAIAVFLGLFIGVTSGYFGGVYDLALMRIVDFMLSLPFLLIAITIHGLVEEPSLWTLYLLLGGLAWTTLARVTRAKVLQVRELEYIQAARALGMSQSRIIFRHVLPNVIGPAIVLGTTLIATMVILESSMSFLGLGVQPPQTSWGAMLYEGRELLVHAPRLVLYPAFMIVLTVFGFNLMGEGLRDAFDPKE